MSDTNGRNIRRDMGKDFRRVTLVTDPGTSDWIKKTSEEKGMTMAAFLDQIVQRARLRKNPLV